MEVAHHQNGTAASINSGKDRMVRSLRLIEGLSASVISRGVLRPLVSIGISTSRTASSGRPGSPGVEPEDMADAATSKVIRHLGKVAMVECVELTF